MERYRNQRALVDNKKLAEQRIVVIGAGAIGSFFVTTIAKMGAKDITVYDFDTIEDHNIANQMYPVYMIGKAKTEALKSVASDYGETEIKTRGRWHPDTAIDGDVIVVCPDNMDLRIAAWNYYKGRDIKLYIDGRMGAQVYKAYAVDMTNDRAKAYYQDTLYPQAEAAQERCGEKSIIYTVLQVAGQMCYQLKAWVMNEYRPTGVTYDCFNNTVSKDYHMELVPEQVEVLEDVEA